MKDLVFSDVEHFRYERKFYLAGLNSEAIEAILRFHPAMFSQIYHQRPVNNIYFDSLDLRHYSDNINGVNRRLKVRIRWYGNLFGFIENPTLELKLKHNFHVGKLLYPLKPFTLDNSFSIETMRRVFEESSLQQVLKLHLGELVFAFLNRYERKYFLSSDRKYRVTIDTNMQVYRLSLYQNDFLDKSQATDTILEIKYNHPEDKFIDQVTNYFPFRLSRSSKYVEGIKRLYA